MRSQQVSIHNCHPAVPVSASFTKQAAALVRKILTSEKVRSCEVSVILVDNRTTSGLNRKYRKIARATDVLAFGFYPHPQTRTDYGDIYISLDKTREQAQDFRVTFYQELQRLLVHGVLHLCGYDHKTGSTARTLERKTGAWLSRAYKSKRR